MIELTQPDFESLILTFRLAFVSLLFLFLIGTPLAWWLANGKSKLKSFVETLVSLPLVLPPTVLGFYLLILLSSKNPLGAFYFSLTGEQLAFSFKGLVIGSILYSLPFVVQPIQSSFTSIGRRPLEVAATLGARPFTRFWLVVLPLARPGFITAAVLGFAHTLGEFGVVLMIGGSIPGKTKVMSISIYDHVEALEYQQAHQLSMLLLLISFTLLFMVFFFNKKFTVGISGTKI